MPRAPNQNDPNDSVGGFCWNCSELRPCSCGKYCPVCLGDIEIIDDQIIKCKSCKHELKLRK